MARFTEVEVALVQIVGRTNVSRDPETLNSYAQDQSFVRSCMPDFVDIPAPVKMSILPAPFK